MRGTALRIGMIVSMAAAVVAGGFSSASSAETAHPSGSATSSAKSSGPSSTAPSASQLPQSSTDCATTYWGGSKDFYTCNHIEGSGQYVDYSNVWARPNGDGSFPDDYDGCTAVAHIWTENDVLNMNSAPIACSEWRGGYVKGFQLNQNVNTGLFCAAFIFNNSSHSISNMACVNIDPSGVHRPIHTDHSPGAASSS